MYRDRLKDLIEWKKSKNRKPLILNGARQVGKTWLLKDEFAKKEYRSMAYVSFYGNNTAKEIFELDLNPERIVNALEVYCETKITPGETLIILDEIQECPKALASLKNFYEMTPDYHIAVAGSLLGVALHKDSSYPVGKVNTMTLYPMNFSEFLRAIGHENMAKAIENGDVETLISLHNSVLDLLKTYFIVGGMPEVVKNYVNEGNILEVRSIQQQIISDYIHDFSKHAPTAQVPKILEIFNILPAELAKENKKFLFSMIRKGARAAEYEDALLWLSNAGVVTRVRRVETVRAPLATYAEQDAFKLYLVDIGLLGALSGLDYQVILEGDRLFVEFKGALAEQFVFQEFVARGLTPYYFRKDKPSREVDFLLDFGHEILPIEVKSGKNTASASLVAYMDDVKPARAIKLSTNSEHRVNRGLEYLPLYLAEAIGPKKAE
ncbi:ATP-binding protein [Candidatus Saccharibacteria bacterium]|nr:ATP-binding protein [Candidatus Saccharibacteria bacterium]